MSTSKKDAANRAGSRAQRRRELRRKRHGGGAGDPESLRGRRFSPEQREHALTLIVSGGMTREKIAALIGTTTESLRRWSAEAKQRGTMPVLPQPVGVEPQAASTSSTQGGEAVATASPVARSLYAPRDPGQGLGQMEVAAILEYKQRHPSMGPAQIRAHMGIDGLTPADCFFGRAGV